jgi:DNA repair protein RecO (recombination protein O)
MRYTTRGIVLHYMKYKETSIIVKIFTEKLGKQAFLIPDVRMPKPTYPIALFQLLVPLELVIYYRENTTLHRIIEAKYHIPITNMLGDIQKAGINTFVAELLNKTLYEGLQNIELFKFLLQALIDFDKMRDKYETFYVGFILHLCTYLGFACGDAAAINAQLMRAGCKYLLTRDEIIFLNQLLQHEIGIQNHPNQASIKNMLTVVIKYMQCHIENLDTLKSLSLLYELNS